MTPDKIPTDLDRIRARLKMVEYGYAVHAGCGGECTTISPVGPQYLCQKCGTRVPRSEVAEVDETRGHYVHDVQFLLSRVSMLESQLEFERDPSGAMVRRGHERECARTQFPRALHPCDCDVIRARRGCEAERLEAALCTTVEGSWTGPPPPGGWLPKGHRYCDGRLEYTPRDGRDEMTCQMCGTVFTEESFGHRGAGMMVAMLRLRKEGKLGLP